MKRSISFANACAQYVHRYTLEHVPEWARRPCRNGRFYAPQYRSDAEWFEATRFPGEDGLSRRREYCESNGQTWPFGQWLKKPCPVFAYLAARDDSKLAEMRADLEWTE